jgi:hypothetical protein
MRYKVSKTKAQLCLEEVLGLTLSKGTHFLGWERIEPILDYPIPTTLKQLRRFLGVTGYCRLWIPRFGETAQPLYRAIKETQQVGTHLITWSRVTKCI